MAEREARAMAEHDFYQSAQFPIALLARCFGADLCQRPRKSCSTQ